MDAERVCGGRGCVYICVCLSVLWERERGQVRVRYRLKQRLIVKMRVDN